MTSLPPFLHQKIHWFDFFFLGFFEFLAAAVWILRIDPDPKNAVLFGYSLQRLAVFILTILPGLVILAAGIWMRMGKRIGWLEKFFDQMGGGLSWLALLLGLLSFLVLVTPPAWLGSFGGYFRRIQPLLWVLCFFPAQFALLVFFKRDWHFQKSTWLIGLFFGALLGLAWLFILLSGYGILPEKEFATGISWSNISGTPLTMFQWLVTLLATLVGVAFLKHRPNDSKWLDLGLALALYLLAVSVWGLTPFKDSTFVVKLSAPYFQPFPLSDAAVHDLGGITILQGQGIFWGEYTDKPLYMAFLALLHFFVGYNYSWLVFLQMAFLALMIPALYWLGTVFHSRPLGILIALLILIRQRNSILLSSVLYYNAAPNLLMTEVPTLLGLIVLVGGLFFWMKEPQGRHALATGGILGALSLIRLNPVLLLPVIPVFTLLAPWFEKKRWGQHLLAYILGFTLLVTPWALTGVNPSGQSYFFIKFYDVFFTRYGQSRLPPDVVQRVAVPSRGGVLSLAHDLPQPEVGRFPGFVINNFFHNVVESILMLPDSFDPERQNLTGLADRFYWKPETFQTERIPFIAVNSILIAFGLAWSWRRWKWAGMVPLLSFCVYSLSLALGRTSGSRYIVPIDWIFCFYYALGALVLLRFFLPRSTSLAFREAEPMNDRLSTKKNFSRIAFGTVLLILALVSAIIPIADNLIPKNTSLCQESDISTLVSGQSGSAVTAGLDFRKGIVLYPKVEKKMLFFDLLSCRQITSFQIEAPDEAVNSGDIVVVGWLAPAQATEPLLASLMIPAE